jgi:F1F0 ATPase subunit 2
MSSLPRLLVALAEGAVLGTLFYSLLWCTVLMGLSSTRPGMLFLASLMLRAAIAVAGFYYVSRGDWHRLAACLIGFLLSRTFALRLARNSPAKQGCTAVEGGA